MQSTHLGNTAQQNNLILQRSLTEAKAMPPYGKLCDKANLATYYTRQAVAFVLPPPDQTTNKVNTTSTDPLTPSDLSQFLKIVYATSLFGIPANSEVYNRLVQLDAPSVITYVPLISLALCAGYVLSYNLIDLEPSADRFLQHLVKGMENLVGAIDQFTTMEGDPKDKADQVASPDQLTLKNHPQETQRPEKHPNQNRRHKRHGRR